MKKRRLFLAPRPEYKNKGDELMAKIMNQCPHENTRIFKERYGYMGPWQLVKDCVDCGAELYRGETR